MPRQDVIIVGAGIAGLVSAICLLKRGIPVRIFESVRKFEPIGAGINLLPHATKALQDIGVLEQIADISSPVEILRFLTASGAEIHREDRGIRAGYDHPQLSVHRGLLHQALVAALRDRWSVEIQMGHAFESFQQNEFGITVRFSTTAGKVVVPGVAMIGCDGIHSAVRKQMFPDEGLPIQSGVEMWRGVATTTQPWPAGQMKLVGSLRDIKLVAYAVGRNGKTADINWVLERKKSSASTGGQGWCEIAQRNELLKIIRQSEITCVDLEGLLENTATVLYYNMVDRDPLPYWTSGVATLLGDAAHPMYPFGSNGACQAILDAVALSSSFAESNCAEHALSGYEKKRREATSQVVLLNREFSPDSILEIVDGRIRKNPSVCPQDAIARDEIADISNRYKKVAGFAVSQLNSAAT